MAGRVTGALTRTAVNDPEVLRSAFEHLDDSGNKNNNDLQRSGDALNDTQLVDREEEEHIGIVRWLRQVCGSGAARLPDGRLIVCGGESVEGSDPVEGRATNAHHPPTTTPAPAATASLRCALLRPSYSTEYAAETSSTTHRAHTTRVCGPLRWTNPVSSDEGNAAARRGLPPALAWHSVVALSDLRVIVFGGRTDARDASCVNAMWVADFSSWVEPAERQVLCQTSGSEAEQVERVNQLRKTSTTRPLPRFAPLFAAVEQRSSRNTSKLYPTSAESLSTSAPRGEPERLWGGGRQAASGPWPCPRCGHAAVILRQDPVLVMVCGGSNSRGEALDDVYLLSVASATAGGGRASTPTRRTIDDMYGPPVTMWWQFLGGSTRPSASKCSAPSSCASLGWTQLPCPASQHHVLVLPDTVSSSSSTVVSKRLLLVVDGRTLFESVVCLSSASRDDPADCGIVSSTPWRKLPGGGLYRSVPTRRGCAVALLSPCEIIVHGGWRVGTTTPIASASPSLGRARWLCANRSGGGGGIASSRVALDAAFVYSLETYAWEYRRSLTSDLSYRAGHHFLPLTTTRLHHVPGIHYLVVGGESFLDMNDNNGDDTGRSMERFLHSNDGRRSITQKEGMTTLSSCFPSGEDAENIRAVRSPCWFFGEEPSSVALGERLCSAVVTRSGLVDLGYLDDAVAEYLRQDRKLITREGASALTAASLEESASRDEHGAPRVEWTEPSLILREQVLQKEEGVGRRRLREHLLHALLLHEFSAPSDEEIRATYFRRWVAHAVEARSATRATWMCLHCNVVPCEQRILPCHHFVLCSTCAAVAERCPSCNVEVSGSEAGFRGHAFPALHRFLAEWQREQMTETDERHRRHRLGGHVGNCDEAPSTSGDSAAPSNERQRAPAGSEPNSPPVALFTSAQFSSPVSRSTRAFDYQTLLAFNAKGSGGGVRGPRPLSTSSSSGWHPPPLVVRMKARKSVAVAGPMIL